MADAQERERSVVLTPGFAALAASHFDDTLDGTRPGGVAQLLATPAAARYTRSLKRPRPSPPVNRPMSERVPLDTAVLSDPGMVRTHNEDSVFVDPAAGIAVLADGMGGYNAGEVASGIAVKVVSGGMVPELNSDGLTDMVEPPFVHAIIEKRREDLATAATELVEAANQNGGRDNISVVLVRVPKEFLPSAAWAQRWLAKKRAG